MPHLQNISYVLEKLSKGSLTHWNEYSTKVKEYLYQNYIYYAQKRSEIFSDLTESLLNECEQYQFDDWQRVVSYKYCLNPLSTQGSIRNPAGGRFNIGNINPTIFPPFGALYLAEDRGTAIREKYGLPKLHVGKDGLSEYELNLTKKESETIVVVSGKMNLVLDLCRQSSLEKFHTHIKKIKTPRHLFKMVKGLKIQPMVAVKTIKQLYQTIFDDDWRYHPNLCNVPANSQILGQIAYEAGVEAILYPSKKDGKRCLAVLPKNFQNGESHIRINANHAPKEMDQELLILNKDTFKQFI